MQATRSAIFQAALLLASTLLAAPAHAGGESTLATLGRAASAGNAVPWARQVDNLATLLDHLQRLWKHGPYAQHASAPSAPASSAVATASSPTASASGRGGAISRRPRTGARPPGVPGSPGAGSSSRTCAYPAGYPRVPAPLQLPSSDNSASIRGLIVREIGSRSNAPAAPDLGKWRADALGLQLSVAAGPVFGAYLLELPYAMSPAQASALIGRMYFADTRDAQRGCRYDYIVPDLPVEAFAFPPRQRPRIAFSVPGHTSTMIASEDSTFPRSVPSIAKGVIAQGWPLLGAWTHVGAAPGMPAQTMAQTPIAVLDFDFLPGSSPNPTGVAYQGGVTYISRDGTAPVPDAKSRTSCALPDDVRSGGCHGDRVSAVLAQDVHLENGPNGDVLGGGILGTNLLYLGTASDPEVATPLLATSDVFPIERVQTSRTEYYMLASMAYAAGRRFGFRTSSQGRTYLTDFLGPAVRELAPLDPAPKVLDMSIGVFASSAPPAPPECQRPMVRAVMKFIERKGIIVVAAAGNDSARYRAALADSQISAGSQVQLVPRDCQGVLVADGAVEKPGKAGGPPKYVKAPSALVASHSAVYWAPFGTAIGLDLNTDHASSRQLEGTSFSAPVIAGTIAMMLSIDPGLSRDQVSRILDQASTLSLGSPPVTFVHPDRAWKLVMQDKLARAASQAAASGVFGGPPGGGVGPATR